MSKTDNIYLEDYNKISDELKHVTNSVIRLQILLCLFDGEMSMKEINNSTGLSYSSISNVIHNLEAEGSVIRESRNYKITNVMELYLNNLIEFNESIKILEEFSDFFNNHKVKNISFESASNLYQLKDCCIIESCGTDVRKTQNFIIDSLKASNSIKAILPISFKELTNTLIDSIRYNKNVELLVFNSIYEEIIDNIDLNDIGAKINFFKDNFNFMLIITENIVIFGLYKKDGVFDQNRLLLTKSDSGFKWANDLFKSFKNKKIDKII